MPDDELSAKEAAKVIARLSWPIHYRNVRAACEEGRLAGELRPVEGQPVPMWFIRRSEAERFAAWRKTQPRRGPKSAKERRAEEVKAIRAKQDPKADPYDPWRR